MNKIKIWNNKASDNQLNQISDILNDGGIGIIPTDTIYAIVGDALNVKVVERICGIKKINPEKQNLSILCNNISMASDYCRIDNKGFKLLKENTPGPFTFLFPSISSLPRAFRGRKTVGIRIPDNDFDISLVSVFNRPLITTSVEFKDDDYAINPDLIYEAYENSIEFFVEGDDGSTDPSTILDCTKFPPEVIRQGKGILE